MKIVEPRVEPVFMPTREEMYGLIEKAGRTCYLSEPKEGDTTEAFIGRVMARKHYSVLEHGNVSLRFICDRGVTHELVRHRLASYSQESTRYCNYGNGKFGQEITVIKPCFLTGGTSGWVAWYNAMRQAESGYLTMLDLGHSPQEARSVLPNSLKTEIVVTMNIRNWRHFCEMRYLGVAGTPHPQMVQVAEMAFELLDTVYPVLFDDLKKPD